MFGERERRKEKGEFLRTKFFHCLLCYLFGLLLRFLERSVDDVYCLVRKLIWIETQLHMYLALLGSWESD